MGPPRISLSAPDRHQNPGPAPPTSLHGEPQQWLWSSLNELARLQQVAAIAQATVAFTRKEGRKFTHPWQPTRLNGWNSVCLSSA